MLQVSPPSRPRVLALAISFAAAALVLWGGLHVLRSRAPKPLEIRHTSPPPPARTPGIRELSELYVGSSMPTRPEEWVFHLTQDVAGAFFTFGEGASYDPWTYARPLPVRDQVMRWPEHPVGEVRTNTNAEGCREDHELSARPRDVRVLVAGDSHTFGVCDDAETLTERLEAGLAARRPQLTTEVLNAAMGGYSFVNYLGTWFRFREFRPQVFLVVVFAGNDFADFLQLTLHFTGNPWPPNEAERYARRAALLESHPEAMAQGLNSIENARAWPAERERTVRDAIDLCGEMERCARAGGAKLVIAFLPSPFLLRWPEDRPPGEDAVRKLEFQPADFQREADQGARFLAGVRAAGIEVVDLTSTLAAETVPPFWRKDLHLSTRGHELVAEALLPVVDRLPQP